jgi:hypothetical protein
MLRAVTTLSLVAFLSFATFVGVWQYRKYTAEQRKIVQLEQQTRQLEQQKQQLQQVVQRLTAEKRVAEILVTERTVGQDGTPTSAILFVEYARDGSTLPPKSFVVRGEHVHVDGMVIEFDGDFVQKGDPLRGHSILLFDKIYGSADRPADAYRIDSPGRIPDLYAAANPQTTQFETDLWSNFWRLVSDEAFRKSKGVRLANGKSLYGPFATDRLYTITLDASGKMSCEDQPIRGAVGEALRRLSSTRD